VDRSQRGGLVGFTCRDLCWILGLLERNKEKGPAEKCAKQTSGAHVRCFFLKRFTC
jgi:hypothetical protein